MRLPAAMRSHILLLDLIDIFQSGGDEILKTVPQYRLEMLIETLFCPSYSKHRRVAAIHRNPVDCI